MALIESLVRGAGGKVDYLMDFPESLHPGIRISLPLGSMGDHISDDTLPPELRSYLSRWRILAAAEKPDQYTELTGVLGDIGVDFEFVDTVIASLTKVQEESPYDAILVERSLFGDDATALLNAIIKLCPESGLTVLETNDHTPPPGTASDFVSVPHSASPSIICAALIESRSLAAHRANSN